METLTSFLTDAHLSVKLLLLKIWFGETRWDMRTFSMYRDLTARKERQGCHRAHSGGLFCQILVLLLAVQLLYRAAGSQCGSSWIWWVKLSFCLCPGITEQYKASWCMRNWVITFISVLFYLVCSQLWGKTLSLWVPIQFCLICSCCVLS